LSSANVVIVALLVPACTVVSPITKLPPVTMGLTQQLSLELGPQLLASPTQLGRSQLLPLPT
jgi:hypothetical protein